MSRSLNQVTIMGNLTRDPELRTTPSGSSVCSFSLALNRSYKNASGEWQEATDYVNLTAWAQLAERVSQYLSRGSRCLVIGRLHSSSWEQDGKKRSKLEVLATDVTFLDNKRNDEATDSPKAEKKTKKQKDDEAFDEKLDNIKKEEGETLEDRQKAVGTLDDQPLNLDDIPF